MKKENKFFQLIHKKLLMPKRLKVIAKEINKMNVKNMLDIGCRDCLLEKIRENG